MHFSPDDFEAFINGRFEQIPDIRSNPNGGLWVRSADMDVTGGKISKEEIDRQLADYEAKDAFTVSGLTQETFEYFIDRYGQELRAIRFFKNKLVKDWSMLGSLPRLEYVYWFHNQRITSLWDMRKNEQLKGLCLSDFTRLHNLDGISQAPNLEFFSMQDAVWNKTVVDSYTCFAGSPVRCLCFAGKKISDEELSFVRDMPRLEIFDFSPNHFRTEKIAWLMANFPKLRGYSLKIFLEDWIYNKETREYDIPALVLTGRGNRKFPACDEKKRKKYEAKFLELMKHARCHTDKNNAPQSLST